MCITLISFELLFLFFVYDDLFKGFCYLKVLGFGFFGKFVAFYYIYICSASGRLDRFGHFCGFWWDQGGTKSESLGRLKKDVQGVANL